MTSKNRTMHLGAFLYAVGHHAGGWRYPDNEISSLLDLEYYKKVATIAEKGKFDLIFFADRLALPDRFGNNFDASVRYFAPFRLDPAILITAISAVTQRIGLAATASTSYNEPFAVARAFATIDHLSKGRSSWNVVTSTNDGEALNFSREEHFDHETRYERAQEFLEVVTRLWDSWEDNALVIDRDSGTYADPGKVHYLKHKGEFFQVNGPLNVPRPPQGRPVLIQAGSSDRGKDFAAQWAEIIFTAQPSLDAAREFYADINARAAQWNREPGSIKIMPGIMPIVGETEEEARRKEALLGELVHPLAGLSLLSDSMNYDLSVHDLDKPFPELTSARGNQSRQKLVAKLAREEGLTLRQLGKRFGASRSHRILAGTPQQIADSMEEWFEKLGCDGFNIMPPYLPGGLDEFVEMVVPELQKRGLFRDEYSGSTLRDHLGLRRPESVYQTPSV
jgi:FMN-dependent oxidoreductase (nitrilotriacetate monooxygenase family)